MDTFIFLGTLILVLIGLPIGLGYYLPKKLGYPNTAKYLTIGYGFSVLTLGLFIAFEDSLFTKNNAREFLEEQGIKITDKFDLIENKSMSGIGDYYHTFTLKISERDKQNAILEIKEASNFKTNNSTIDQMLYLSDKRYFGPTVTQNYETKNGYVREFFQPSGRKGYAPIFRRISISKTENTLTFEDIDE